MVYASSLADSHAKLGQPSGLTLLPKSGVGLGVITNLPIRSGDVCFQTRMEAIHRHRSAMETSPATDPLWKPHRPPPSRFENNLIKKAFNAIHKFRAKIELDPFRSKCAKRLDINMRVVAANLNGYRFNGLDLFIRSAPLRSHAGQY
ncbi:hypothetical protein LINPERHAP2_LOCUS213 [Linum perenne]